MATFSSPSPPPPPPPPAPPAPKWPSCRPLPVDARWIPKQIQCAVHKPQPSATTPELATPQYARLQWDPDSVQSWLPGVASNSCPRLTRPCATGICTTSHKQEIDLRLYPQQARRIQATYRALVAWRPSAQFAHFCRALCCKLACWRKSCCWLPKSVHAPLHPPVVVLFAENMQHHFSNYDLNGGMGGDG